MSLKKYAAIISALLLSSTVNAEQIWSDASISFLNGSNYEVGDSERSVITLEHASGHTWGSTFVFVDRLHDSNFGGNETYGEMSAKITLFKPKDGFIKDVYFSPQLEFGSNPFNNFNNYLFGVGANLNIASANFFNVTFFTRKNDLSDDSNSQVTLVWSFPVTGSIVFDGFADLATSHGSASAQQNITSQLKYDVGQHLGVKKGHLYAGIEYVYWNNKFGIDGITESNVNFLVKWHL